MKEEIVGRLRGLAREAGLQALIAMSPENFAYSMGVLIPSQLTVRSRHALGIIPVEGPDPTIIAVDIEEPVARERAWYGEIRTYNEFTQDPMNLLADCLAELGLGTGRVGIEVDYLPARARDALAARLPHASIEAADGFFLTARQRKTAGEIERIRIIGRLAAEVLEGALREARPGMTEADLGRRITGAYLGGGGDRLTMLVVGSGERSTLANAAPTRRVLQPGDLLRVDVIGTREYYYSDFCRTAVVGKASAEQERTWGLLFSARDRLIEDLRPGVGTGELYRSYAAFMAEHGLPVINFVGHGLGLTLHEEPYVGRYGSTILEEGMTLCIEPMCFLPGRGGYQVEDEILITGDGCEVLTAESWSRKLFEIS
ncbi:MAG: aminopeptidase P family protein [Firmicutes bacterium]|nr:aminopeptidase P family protein [Bacillota bacterium]